MILKKPEIFFFQIQKVWLNVWIWKQDKVDGNGAESKINNNWEKRQNSHSKIGGFMASWPYSFFEKIQVYKLFLQVMNFFTKLDQLVSISNAFEMLSLIIWYKVHFNNQIFNLSNLTFC